MSYRLSTFSASALVVIHLQPTVSWRLSGGSACTLYIVGSVGLPRSLPQSLAECVSHNRGSMAQGTYTQHLVYVSAADTIYCTNGRYSMLSSSSILYLVLVLYHGPTSPLGPSSCVLDRYCVGIYALVLYLVSTRDVVVSSI